MTQNRILSFIHEIRALSRKWKNLSPEQRRVVLAAVGDNPDEKVISKAIRKVRRVKE